MSRDWDQLLASFEETTSEMSLCAYKLAAARSWVRFLKQSSSEADEATLLTWTIQNIPESTLEVVVGRLYWIDPFVRFLTLRGVCSEDAARRVRERPDLLMHLQSFGPFRFMSVVDAYWEPLLSRFVPTLRGLSARYQVQLLRAAREFAARVPVEPIDPSAWETLVMEWLDELLDRYGLETVRSNCMPGLDRFLQFLVHQGECQDHPLRRWRQRQVEWVDALRRRQEGKPPRLRPPRFRSFLAPELEAFLEFKWGLGRKRVNTSTLRALDGYLCSESVSEVGQLDAPFLLRFLASRDYKPLSRRAAISALRQFFGFLERRGLLSPEQNPVRHLPRIRRPSRIPYIFTVQEIVNVLSELLEDPIRPPFDCRMHFTLFYLLYACGLRISEAHNLRVRDLDWGERTLFIRDTKFGKERKIPFGPRAAEHLERYHRLRCERLGQPRDEAHFFVRAVDRRAHPATLRVAFREACHRAGVGGSARPRPRPHDLRHSMAVHRLYKWYQEGADPQQRLVFLSLYMGHVNPSSTQYYLNLSQDLLRVAGRPLQRTLDEWMKENLPPDE